MTWAEVLCLKAEVERLTAGARTLQVVRMECLTTGEWHVVIAASDGTAYCVTNLAQWRWAVQDDPVMPGAAAQGDQDADADADADDEEVA